MKEVSRCRTRCLRNVNEISDNALHEGSVEMQNEMLEECHFLARVFKDDSWILRSASENDKRENKTIQLNPAIP